MIQDARKKIESNFIKINILIYVLASFSIKSGLALFIAISRVKLGFQPTNHSRSFCATSKPK